MQFPLFLKTTLLGAVISVTSVNTAHAVTQKEYDRLIIGAREGNYAPALEMLRAQKADDMRAAFDFIIISKWASMPEETIRAWELIRSKNMQIPADVFASAAGAYRDRQQWTQALTTYQNGLRTYPDNPNLAVGEVMVLADMGRSNESLGKARTAERRWPANVDVQLAKSYAYSRLGDYSGVLRSTETAHELAPQTKYVTSEYIQALQQTRLPSPALDVARSNPDVLSPAQMRALQADYAAELTRLATLPDRTEKERFQIADKAIAIYEQIIPGWRQLGDQAQADVTRGEIDYLLALHARSRMTDVIANYERLQAAGVKVPDYALGAVASAYLARKKPDTAREIFARIQDTDADAVVSSQDAFHRASDQYYSLIESNEYDEAQELIDRRVAEQPVWKWVKGQPEHLPNDYKYQFTELSAMNEYYRDNTPAASRQLQQMIEKAPNNTSLRVSLGSVYRGMQLPRAAERELKMAETLSPRSITTETEQALTALDLQEWEQADLLVADVYDRDPQSPSVRDLKRQWDLHNKGEVRLSANRGLASDSPVSGNGDQAYDLVAYTPPIDRNWRIFAGGGYAKGNFEEGDIRYRWMRGGLEWRKRDLTVQAEVSSNSYGFGAKPGFMASVSYDINDHWQTGVTADVNSRQTPLRALQADISSKSVEAFVRWRANERREWSLSVAGRKFSDDNRRTESALTGRERVYTAPRLKADLGLEVSASHNTGKAVPYFNPESDLLVLPSVTLTHRLYEYDRNSVEQTLKLGAGIYSQKGYGTGSVQTAEYGLRYRSSGGFEAGASVAYLHRPYDGEKEKEVRVLLDVAFRY